MGYKSYSLITCPSPTEGTGKYIVEGLHCKEVYSMEKIMHLKNRCIRITR